MYLHMMSEILLRLSLRMSAIGRLERVASIGEGAGGGPSARRGAVHLRGGQIASIGETASRQDIGDDGWWTWSRHTMNFVRYHWRFNHWRDISHFGFTYTTFFTRDHDSMHNMFPHSLACNIDEKLSRLPTYLDRHVCTYGFT